VIVNDLIPAIKQAYVAFQDIYSIVVAIKNAMPDNPFSGGPGGAAGRTARVGHRALGGPVTAGASYMVGERGPELFTPRISGRITPNGGGAMQVNLVLDRKVLASVMVDADKTYRRHNAGRSLFAV
jgi:hypothetical protein